MAQPLHFLSVVVPTRNRARLLRDCVESLIAQDSPAVQYEIIVVDDGSTDETPEVVHDVRARVNGPELRYVRPEARGLNVARNAGLAAARGDPIAFVDDDVLAPPSWLRAVADGILRHSEAACVGGPVRLLLEGRAPRFCARDSTGETELSLGNAERPVAAVVGANMALRRAAITSVGTFNEALSGFGDESEWQLRLARAGGRIVYLPEAWVWHRRIARDLRLWSLLRARFRRGRQEVTFARVVGQPMSLSKELREIPRFVAHAVRGRCAGGMMSASTRVGRAWGLIWDRGASGVVSR